MTTATTTAAAAADESVKPEVTEAASAAAAAANDGPKGPTRLEKKSRKTLAKLGLTPVPGVSKVVVRKARDVNLTVATPDVFKVNGAECYVVFGAATMEDANRGLNFPGLNEMLDMSGNKATDAAAAPAAATPAPDSEQLPDVAEANVALVMNQGGCSRQDAVDALRKNNNDVVEAIMSVSTA